MYEWNIIEYNRKTKLTCKMIVQVIGVECFERCKHTPTFKHTRMKREKKNNENKSKQELK